MSIVLYKVNIHYCKTSLLVLIEEDMTQTGLVNMSHYCFIHAIRAVVQYPISF